MKLKKALFFCVFFYAFSSSAGWMELEWQHYTSQPTLPMQMEDYVFFNWDQTVDFHVGNLYFNSRFQLDYSLDRGKLFYFNVPSAYFFYEYQLKKPLYYVESIKFNIGRQINVWSIADEYWDMGLWNSLSNRNPLHPVTNGLVGSLLSLSAPRWSLDFFLGFLHLPNQGVKLIKDDREIYSRSRWFFPFPDRETFLDVDINYLIDVPFIFDILLQQSRLLSFKTWSKTPQSYYWMKWSIADKPVNHLFIVLNKKNVFNVGAGEDNGGEINQSVTFLPVRQRIFSAEWGIDYNDLSAVFTMESVRMKEVNVNLEAWDFINYRESFTYFSALLRYNFFPNSFIQGAYIQSWFKNYNISDMELMNKKPPSILRKHKILNGIGLDWQTEFLSSKGLPRAFILNYRYSFFNQGGWLFFKTLYYLTPKIYVLGTFDILGAKDNIGNYFLNKFRHNDYFSLRLGYDF